MSHQVRVKIQTNKIIKSIWETFSSFGYLYFQNWKNLLWMYLQNFKYSKYSKCELDSMADL